MSAPGPQCRKSTTDKNQNKRWLILTPMDRGDIMAGPETIPVADWSRVTVHDMDTQACAPFTVTIDLNAKFLPSKPAGADVYLLPKNSSVAPITQGRVGEDGKISLSGVHDGDTLAVTFFGLSNLGEWSNAISTLALKSTLHCSVAASDMSTAELVPSVDEFSLAVSTQPQAADRMHVRVLSTAPLSAPPTVTMWQTGSSSPMNVALGPPPSDASSSVFVGSAQLDTALESSGLLHITARDKQGHEVWTIHPFALTTVQAGELSTENYSVDGMARPVAAPEQPKRRRGSRHTSSIGQQSWRPGDRERTLHVRYEQCSAGEQRDCVDELCG